MLELYGKRSTPSLPLLPGLLWSGVVAPDKVLSMGQLELFDNLNWVQTKDLCWIELFKIKLFDPLTVCKLMTLIELFEIHSNI